MAKNHAPLEKLWSDLLSKQKELIQHAFDSCTPSEQRNIANHLRRMATEADWHVEQQKSAMFALKILKIK